jgi:glycoprotein endo-alpha-1,2-mannosidase
MLRLVNGCITARPPLFQMLIVLAISLLCGLCACANIRLRAVPPPRTTPGAAIPRQVWIVYHGDWANNDTDGHWGAWRRQKDDYSGDFFEPPDSIPSVLHPQLGIYSSHDLTVLRSHIEAMAQVGVDVIVFPWHGSSSFVDETLRLLFPLAAKSGLGILPFISNYPGRNSTTIRTDLEYYGRMHMSHPAQYKLLGKPAVVIYDAHSLQESWQFLAPIGGVTFLGSANGLNDFFGMFEEGYAGFLTYFAGEELTWCGNPENWPQLAASARERGMVFIPAVAPGYNNSAVTRWNARMHRPRNCSDYYDRRWVSALATEPDIILINSFNDWPEGSAIEPAVEKPGFPLTDHIWCGATPDANYYLERTREWVEKFKAKK